MYLPDREFAREFADLCKKYNITSMPKTQIGIDLVGCFELEAHKVRGTHVVKYTAYQYGGSVIETGVFKRREPLTPKISL